MNQAALTRRQAVLAELVERALEREAGLRPRAVSAHNRHTEAASRSRGEAHEDVRREALRAQRVARG